MQIHELTKRTVTEASIADRIKSAATAVKTGMQNAGDAIAANNVAQATAQQQKTQAQAAKYAQILQRQGYGTAATAPAQQTVAPAQTPAQPISIGGQTLDPNNPNYANLIAKAQAAQQPAATTPAQPTAPATATPAAAATTTQPAGAVNTNRLQAGAVSTSQAGAVMTTPDFNAAIRQLNLTPAHIDSLKDSFAKNTSFATAFLKATGLTK